MPRTQGVEERGQKEIRDSLRSLEALVEQVMEMKEEVERVQWRSTNKVELLQNSLADIQGVVDVVGDSLDELWEIARQEEARLAGNHG